MKRRVISAAACALAVMTAAAPALAQSAAGGDMTEQQMIDAFNRQKTRGLSIAPVGKSQPAAPETPSTAGTEVAFQPVPDTDAVFVKIQFDFDSAALREDQKPRLDSLCNAMKAVEADVFQVIGHTDAAGSAEYNERLSKLRAEEVKRHLVSDCGIAPKRLQAIGVGESNLWDPEHPRADVNRRVEFQVLG